MLKKTNISYLNLAIQSPSLELNLALSEKIHRESELDNHIIFMCDKALTSCSVNVFNKVSICNLCTSRAKNGFRHFKKRNPNSELIKIKRSDLKISETNNNQFSDKEKNEILLGVHSTIATQLRLEDMNLLDTRWLRVKKNMLDSSFSLFVYFNNFFKNNLVDNFIIFNGRLSCSRPLIEVSKKNSINYYLFDAALNGKVPMYSYNEMFHSIEFEKRNSLITYLKWFKESNEIAEEYFTLKRNKVAVNDTIYTKNQIDGFIDNEIKELKKPIVSIFVSSDDEYRFIGSDWSSYEIVDQIESINKIIDSNLSKKFDFVVKMHPNQKNIHTGTMNKYKKLSEKVTVMFPYDKTDSYALIEHSEFIICYSSSIALDANYMRKPVVQIGPSIFMKFLISTIARNTEEAIEIISQKKYKIMPIRGSIISYTYHMRSSFKLDSYHFEKDGVYKYGGKLLRSPLYLRLLAVPAKLYAYLIKGDKEILYNFNMHLKNLMFGQRQVK